MERCCNRVRLYGITHKPKCQCDQYCKNSSKDFSKCSLKCCSYVVNRSSCDLAVCSDCLILLCHNRFCIDSCHSKECRDPHPEDCSRSSNCKCCCCSGNITGSYLCCNCCCQCLEWWHSIRSGFSFLTEQTAKSSFHSFAKSSYLDKPKSEREPKART